jgi:hypothetical protein
MEIKKYLSIKDEHGQANSRLLIIIYALGLVVLGAYPYQNKYRDAFESLKRQGANFFTSIGQTKSLELEVSETPDIKALKITGSKTTKKQNERKELTQKNDLDRLQPRDRKELSSLIDSL